VFDFIRKSMIFDAWGAGHHTAITKDNAYHLKTAQDLVVWTFLRKLKGQTIAEIGGGASRILPALAKHNDCYNIEKFQGADGGPSAEIVVPGTKNILAFLGEKSGGVPEAFFDTIFSVSVVEHVPTVEGLTSFFEEGLASLKPGGLWLHAIDLYVTDNPSPYWRERFEVYRGWATDKRVTPVGRVFAGPLRFSTNMASNPDSTMFQWSQVSSNHNALRRDAQSVSVFVAARKS